MCDFSLHLVKSRPAKVGDKLRTVYFNTGTRGFAAPGDSTTAVCILPGTELAFSEEVKCNPTPFGFSSWKTKTVNYRTAIFRQVNKDIPPVHQDGHLPAGSEARTPSSLRIARTAARLLSSPEGRTQRSRGNRTSTLRTSHNVRSRRRLRTSRLRPLRVSQSPRRELLHLQRMRR